MRTLFTIAAICFLGTCLLAQDTYQNFTFVYVDNSALGPDGLSIEQATELEKLVNLEEKDSKFTLYISNRDNPFVANDKIAARKIFNQMLTQNTKFPDNIMSEKENIRKEVYKQPFVVSKKIEVYFFVTDYYFQTLLQQEPAHLTGALPRELKWMAGNKNTEVKVYVYLNEKKSSKLENSTKEKLSFQYRGFERAPDFYILPN